MKGRDHWKVLLIIFASLFFITSCVGLAYGVHTLYGVLNPGTLFADGNKTPVPPDDPGRTPAPSEQPSPEQDPGDGDKPPVEFPDPEYVHAFQSNRVNILLLGIDEAPERNEAFAGFQPDVLMLLSIDFDKNDIFLLSVPRDTFVEIPGFEDNHIINASFNMGGGAHGGHEKTMETVSHLLGGIPVHYYIAVNIPMFKVIVDLVGGVEYDVDIHVIMNHREIFPGVQHLTGQQVLDYCRERSTGLGDISRVDRQQRIMIETFRQIQAKATIIKLPEIFMAVREDIQTNLTSKQVAGLAIYGRKVDIGTVRRATIPGGIISHEGRFGLWGVDQIALKRLVYEFFGHHMEPDMKNDISHWISWEEKWLSSQEEDEEDE